jgi:hypothetical protein
LCLRVGGSEKRECGYLQTNTYFQIVFFFTESWGTVVRFREKKNLVLNYGNIFVELCSFFDHIFFGQKVAKKCRKPFPYFFFPPHCCLFFCSFLFHRVISGGFFSCHQIILTFAVCFFSTGNWVWKTRAEYIFFFWLPKNQNIYLLCFFWWFLALFFQCMHANMLAKIKESEFCLFFCSFCSNKRKTN